MWDRGCDKEEKEVKLSKKAGWSPSIGLDPTSFSSGEKEREESALMPSKAMVGGS